MAAALSQALTALSRLLERARPIIATSAPSSSSSSAASDPANTRTSTLDRCIRDLAGLSKAASAEPAVPLHDSWARLRCGLGDLEATLRARAGSEKEEQGAREARDLGVALAAWIRRLDEQVGAPPQTHKKPSLSAQKSTSKPSSQVHTRTNSSPFPSGTSPSLHSNLNSDSNAENDSSSSAQLRAQLFQALGSGTLPDASSRAPDGDAQTVEGWARMLRSKKMLEDAWLLHQLALEPRWILPPSHQPGKLGRLASFLALQGGGAKEKGKASEKPAAGPGGLEERVAETMRKAFFDEALASLCSPTPVPQRAERLTALHSDVAEAVLPLLPPPPRRPLSTPDAAAAASSSRGVSAQYVQARDLIKFLRTPTSKTAEQHEQEIQSSFEPVKTAEAMENLMQILKSRCAPVRDTQARALSEKAEHAFARLREFAASSTAASSTSGDTSAETDKEKEQSALRFLVDLIAGILKLAEDMRADLVSFSVSSGSASGGSVGGSSSFSADKETQLQRIVEALAEEKEREAVLELGGGREGVRARWDAWLAEGGEAETGADSATMTPLARWRTRLLDALFADQPIALPDLLSPPSTSTSTPPSTAPTSSATNTADSSNARAPNTLPPPLLLSARKLFKLQNKFQALVIVACLISLVGPGPSAHTQPSPSTTPTPPPALNANPNPTEPNGREGANGWVGRVWTLLSSELVEGPDDRDHFPAAEGGSTKITHLIAEVVRAKFGPSQGHPSSNSNSPSPQEGSQNTHARKALEDSVLRVLRYEDPVYSLLKRRLKSGLVGAIVGADVGAHLGEEAGSDGQGVPNMMRSGRAVGRPSAPAYTHTHGSPTSTSTSTTTPTPISTSITIPAFSHPPILRESVREAGEEVHGICRWVERVWESEVRGADAGADAGEGLI